MGLTDPMIGDMALGRVPEGGTSTSFYLNELRLLPPRFYLNHRDEFSGLGSLYPSTGAVKKKKKNNSSRDVILYYWDFTHFLPVLSLSLSLNQSCNFFFFKPVSKKTVTGTSTLVKLGLTSLTYGLDQPIGGCRSATSPGDPHLGG
ncbi:hypothetical protein RchiOBHm_Chr1g0353461 [Rosa chinensis]|uniref:Uncharacterized protein n=1 Tax=Rosa chinensis TaxID=74649 RepID=A0A2P6SGV8_ROSCH|nr:hypothetical protein RchiOBHm_Chr1g0353461 [Rosa chinensis]